MLKTISKEDQLEAARTETTLEIAKWIKEHPYATQVNFKEPIIFTFIRLILYLYGVHLILIIVMHTKDLIL